MKRCGGFTLLELLLYLAIFSIIIPVLGRASVQVITRLSQLYKQTNDTIREGLFIDILRRDLLCASPAFAVWDIEHFVFRTERFDSLGELCYVDIGFKIIDHDLVKRVVRYEGQYDFERLLWRKKSASVITDNIDMICLSVNNAQMTFAVSYRLIGRGKTKSFCVRLRNGPT